MLQGLTKWSALYFFQVIPDARTVAFSLDKGLTWS